MDRRSSQRMRVLLRVEYQDRADFLEDYVMDLGEGGMFIRTDLPFEPGQSLRVLLSFPGLLDPTPVDAVVRWRRKGEGQPSDQVGVGVEFLPSTSGERERVLALVRRLDAAHGDTPHPGQGPLRVLLVEDNKFVTELFRHAVMRFQAGISPDLMPQVHVASSGVEALRVLEREPVDFVIVDHYLPGITGCTVVRKLRERPEYERTPVLMVSVGGEDVRREALEAGATLYMSKPALLTQLLDTLRVMVPMRGVAR